MVSIHIIIYTLAFSYSFAVVFGLCFALSSTYSLKNLDSVCEIRAFVPLPFVWINEQFKVFTS